MADIDVVDNHELRRFEITVDGKIAGFSVYRTEPGAVVFTHTEIDPAFEGQGLGSKLAAAALKDVRDRGLEIVPLCPFIAAYLKRHPE
jgi:predicted GNAT family acetyltransferase